MLGFVPRTASGALPADLPRGILGSRKQWVAEGFGSSRGNSPGHSRAGSRDQPSRESSDESVGRTASEVGSPWVRGSARHSGGLLLGDDNAASLDPVRDLKSSSDRIAAVYAQVALSRASPPEGSRTRSLGSSATHATSQPGQGQAAGLGMSRVRELGCGAMRRGDSAAPDLQHVGIIARTNGDKSRAGAPTGSKPLVVPPTLRETAAASSG